MSIVRNGLARLGLTTDAFIGAHPDVAVCILGDSVDICIFQTVVCRIYFKIIVIASCKVYKSFGSCYPHIALMVL